jgi:acyl dehydratase
MSRKGMEAQGFMGCSRLWRVILKAMYLEDFPVGTRWSAGELTVTAAEAIEFASRYDPQPMHIDAAAAAKGRFGALIASGWHTAALAMGAMVRAQFFGDAEILGLGVDQMQWPTPVMHGDTLRIEVEVVGSTPSRSKPEFGIMKIRIVAQNQRDQVALVLISNCWIPRRPT